MTAGVDKLDYPGNASSPAVSMLDAKLHINSTISDAKNRARYLSLDIKIFYLGTPMSSFLIHTSPPIHHSERNLERSPLHHSHRQRWLRLPRNPSRHVWPQGSRHSRFQPTGPQIETSRIRTHAVHTRSLAPSHKAHHVRSLRFRRKIFFQGRRHASHRNRKSTLRLNHRLGRKTVLRPRPQLALQQRLRRYLHAPLRRSRPKKFDHPAPLRPQHAPHQ
jgi:hypothetical protein